jgi:hypothetical protein
MPEKPLDRGFLTARQEVRIALDQQDTRPSALDFQPQQVAVDRIGPRRPSVPQIMRVSSRLPRERSRRAEPGVFHFLTEKIVCDAIYKPSRAAIGNRGSRSLPPGRDQLEAGAGELLVDDFSVLRCCLLVVGGEQGCAIS